MLTKLDSVTLTTLRAYNRDVTVYWCETEGVLIILLWTLNLSQYEMISPERDSLSWSYSVRMSILVLLTWRVSGIVPLYTNRILELVSTFNKTLWRKAQQTVVTLALRVSQ